MTTKKADYIWFNGEMVRWEDAKVHVMSHALHYGTSVFEGIRCYDSHKGPVVFRHREHMQRLHDSAKIYRFPVSQSIDELMEACRDVIRKNNLTSVEKFIPHCGHWHFQHYLFAVSLNKYSRFLAS